MGHWSLLNSVRSVSLDFDWFGMECTKGMARLDPNVFSGFGLRGNYGRDWPSGGNEGCKESVEEST